MSTPDDLGNPPMDNETKINAVRDACLSEVRRILEERRTNRCTYTEAAGQLAIAFTVLSLVTGHEDDSLITYLHAQGIHPPTFSGGAPSRRYGDKERGTHGFAEGVTP